MCADEVKDLQHRIDRLEVRERRRRAHTAIAGIALLGLLGSFTTADSESTLQTSVRAQEFVLVNEKGKVTGTWKSDKRGEPVLALRDLHGTERYIVQVQAGEITQVIRDEKGTPRIGFSIDSGHHPHFVMSDEHSKPRMHMSINMNGSPTQLFIHKDGTMPVQLAVLDDGRAYVKPGNEPKK